MTAGPGAAPSRQERYDQLLQQAGAALIGAAPPGWRRIDLVVRVAAGVQDFGLCVVMADLGDVAVEPPAEAARALVELRELTATPELGAWFSARYVIDPPGEFRIHYNHDHDPLWDPPIPPDAFGRDLAAHPRPAGKVPGWLRRRLDPAAAASPGDAAPEADAHPDRIPPAPFGLEQQRHLQRKVTDLLVLRAPADRDQVRVMFRAAGTHVDVVGDVLGLDGRLREWEPPPEVGDVLRRLRAGMYRPGVGTWSAASIVVEYPMRTSFDFRDDPRWRQPPPRSAVLEELEMFPRSPEAVPDWMKALLPAAHPAVAGEVPAPGPDPAPGGGAGPGGGTAGLDERERSVLAIIERRVSEAGAIPEAYRLLGSREGATCLERVGDGWQVADYERGRPRNPQRFAHLWDAGAHLLGALTLTPSSLRAGGGDRNTAHAINDWPIQPLPGEPPLTLLTDKHIAVLMPGRELVRHGAPAGNLTFAAGTAFDAMSLRAEREQQGPHLYRVVRELRTLSGRTVPWHGRPGGGTAYLLPEAVERHLANGSLTPTTTGPGPGG